MHTDLTPKPRRAVIRTISGVYIDLANPRPEDIRLEDIAHGLAHTNRWAGHTLRPYSVAQHSCVVSCLMGGSLRYPRNGVVWSSEDVSVGAEGLLHDAHEAYLCDLPRPLKRLLPEYAGLARGIDAAIRARFGLAPEKTDTLSAYLATADLIALAWEFRDVVLGGVPTVRALDSLPVGGDMGVVRDYLPHAPNERLFAEPTVENARLAFLVAAAELGIKER